MFELSNEDRLGIIKFLKEEALNITDIARRLSMTTQETSRHVSRLRNIGLIKKDKDGKYGITTYASTVLIQIEGLEFASRHKDYFSNHILDNLPPKFVYRIGDLANSRYINDMGAALFLVEKVIRESESYIWSITDRIAPSRFLTLMTKAFDRGVTVRTLVSLTDRVILPSTTEWLDTQRKQETADVLKQARIEGKIQERIHDRSKVYICMSEKEVAGIAFPYRDGRFDYLGFTSVDERAHDWCRDLFMHYWERAELRSDRVQRILDWLTKKPRELRLLKSLAMGKDTMINDKILQELEEQKLVMQRHLSLLGLLVYRRIE